MNRFIALAVTCLVLIAGIALGAESKKAKSAKPDAHSDSPLDNYSQGGVVVDGIAYFTADDANTKSRGLVPPEFHAVTAFDAKTMKPIRSYAFDRTYDSSPFLFQKKDGTWLIIAHEHSKKRTAALRKDNGEAVWTSEANQPGNLFFGYSSFKRADGTQLIFQAATNGLHAMSGETGKDVWYVEQASDGGVTPCVDQKNGWVFYQGNGKVYKIQAEDGKVLKSVDVPSPNACVSWNTVLVDDSNGYFVATRWYGEPQWDSAFRVYDKDLNPVWEKLKQPTGKKDTLTYAEGRLLSGSGNHWSMYKGTDWKVITAYSIKDGSVVWTCDLSKIGYESLPNLPFYNGFYYGETNGAKVGSSHLLRIDGKTGKIVEDLDYGYQIGSCAAAIIGRGMVLSGCLREARVMVTQIADDSKADWPGPFGDPQTNTFALGAEPGAKLVKMAEIGHSVSPGTRMAEEAQAGPKKAGSKQADLKQSAPKKAKSKKAKSKKSDSEKTEPKQN